MTFSNNSVRIYGSAVYSAVNCKIIITGNSKVAFINNEAFPYGSGYNGSTIYSKHSHIYFEGNSVTLFKNNLAGEGN